MLEGYGLQIPVTYTCTKLEKAVASMERKMTEDIKTIDKKKFA